MLSRLDRLKQLFYVLSYYVACQKTRAKELLSKLKDAVTVLPVSRECSFNTYLPSLQYKTAISLVSYGLQKRKSYVLTKQVIHSKNSIQSRFCTAKRREIHTYRYLTRNEGNGDLLTVLLLYLGWVGFPRKRSNSGSGCNCSEYPIFGADLVGSYSHLINQTWTIQIDLVMVGPTPHLLSQ